MIKRIGAFTGILVLFALPVFVVAYWAFVSAGSLPAPVGWRECSLAALFTFGGVVGFLVFLGALVALGARRR